MDSIITKRHGAVEVITLNRPSKMNALDLRTLQVFNEALAQAEGDDAVAVIVITGNAKAFCVGADIADFEDFDSFAAVEDADFISRNWEQVAKCRKPVLAAVAGLCLGGGCELAMMCDTIVAADDATFAQPEIKVGFMPGAGGTQRLTRAVGKAKAMAMCLSGEAIDAAAAERAGLVAQVVPAAKLLDATLELAAKIAANSRPALRMVKEAVNAAYETQLGAGLKLERKLCHAAFALEDRREGMAAFKAKRKPKFKNS